METISLSEIEKFITFELLSIKRRKNALVFPSTPKKIIGGNDIMVFHRCVFMNFELTLFHGTNAESKIRSAHDTRSTRY